MPTVDQVARDALAAIGSVEDGLVSAHRWVSRRYEEVCDSVRMRHLRRAGMVTIPAPVSTGTIDLLRGTREVVGTGTAFLPTMVGHWIRPGNVGGMYEVVGVADATHLTLGTEYANADLSDGGYAILQRYVALAPEVRFTTSWVVDRLWLPLDSISLRALDELAPARFYLTTLGVGGGYVAHVGEQDGKQLYEVYPYARESVALHFVYYVAPPELKADQSIPSSVPASALLEGVLIDTYRYAMGLAAKEGRVDVMATWRNEMNSQRTVWESVKQRIVRADRGADDTEWLFRTIGAAGARDGGGVRTARDHIYAQGNRP